MMSQLKEYPYIFVIVVGMSQRCLKYPNVLHYQSYMTEIRLPVDFLFVLVFLVNFVIVNVAVSCILTNILGCCGRRSTDCFWDMFLLSV